MSYVSRIPADPEYLRTLGRAAYNFAYLEWVAIWTIVKLSKDGFLGVPKGATSNKVAGALHKAIDGTSPALPAALRAQLFAFLASFRKAVSLRNKLLHAHPYTADGGEQQLGGGGVEWPVSDVVNAAMAFEETAIEGNAIFHGPLAQVRP